MFLKCELVHLPTACKNIFPLNLQPRHSAETRMAGPLREQPRERTLVLRGLKRSWNGSRSLELGASSSGLGGWT